MKLSKIFYLFVIAVVGVHVKAQEENVTATEENQGEGQTIVAGIYNWWAQAVNEFTGSSWFGRNSWGNYQRLTDENCTEPIPCALPWTSQISDRNTGAWICRSGHERSICVPSIAGEVIARDTDRCGCCEDECPDLSETCPCKCGDNGEGLLLNFKPLNFLPGFKFCSANSLAYYAETLGGEFTCAECAATDTDGSYGTDVGK